MSSMPSVSRSCDVPQSGKNLEPSAGDTFQTSDDTQESGAIVETPIRKLSLAESVPQPNTIAVRQPEGAVHSMNRH